MKKFNWTKKLILAAGLAAAMLGTAVYPRVISFPYINFSHPSNDFRFSFSYQNQLS